MKHSDYITHISNKQDEVYLKSKHFPVNMRLFHSSKEYRDIILQQCNYIRKMALTQKDGYSKPYGMSSANVGLAFNIVGIVCNRNKKDEYCEIMINPDITYRSKETVKALSNCGSVTLDKPISIERNKEVSVSYFNENGEFKLKVFSRENGSLTVQHEVEHNLGILITDKISREGRYNNFSLGK